MLVALPLREDGWLLARNPFIPVIMPVCAIACAKCCKAVDSIGALCSLCIRFQAVPMVDRRMHACHENATQVSGCGKAMAQYLQHTLS